MNQGYTGKGGTFWSCSRRFWTTDDDSKEEKVWDLEPDLVQTLAQFLQSHVVLSKLFVLFESQHPFVWIKYTTTASCGMWYKTWIIFIFWQLPMMVNINYQLDGTCGRIIKLITLIGFGKTHLSCGWDCSPQGRHLDYIKLKREQSVHSFPSYDSRCNLTVSRSCFTARPTLMNCELK